MLERLILMLGLALLSIGPAVALPAGDSQFELAEPTGAMPDAPLRVFAHRPASWTPDRPILIVMHGVNRDADRYLAEWRELASERNVLVVCPEFSATKYPDVRWYNLGNVMDSDQGGAPQPEAQWTFGVVDRVFEAVRARTHSTRTRFALFGHSAGAQFVHRYLMFARNSAAEPIVAANAGWYTMPSADAAFPYGLGGTNVAPAKLTEAFARPVVILLGEDDTDPQHRSLRRNADADRQGLHRLARGKRFFETSKAEAARLGVPFTWRLETVPGVGHSNAGMARRAIELVDR